MALSANAAATVSALLLTLSLVEWEPLFPLPLPPHRQLIVYIFYFLETSLAIWHCLLTLLPLFQLCFYHCHLLSENHCSHCHYHRIMMPFPSMHHKVLGLLLGVAVINDSAACCCLWCPSLSLSPLPLSSPFQCWPSLSTVTIATVAVDHCHWPLLLPSPSPPVDCCIIIVIFALFCFISVVVTRYPHHCHCCCCYCRCYCHYHHHHCGASAVLHATGCSSSPTCSFFFFRMSYQVAVQQWTGLLFHFMYTCTTIVHVGYYILQKSKRFPSSLLSYSRVRPGMSKWFATVWICRIKILQRILGLL